MAPDPPYPPTPPTHSYVQHSCTVYSGLYSDSVPPPPCISYAKVPNQYGPYAYCSLDTGVACARHIQLPTPGARVQKERIAW